MARRTWILALALLVSLPALVTAQGGWRKGKYPELGVEIPEPKNHEVIPVQPNEPFLLKQYVEKKAKRERDRKRVLGSIDLVRIDWVDDPPPPAPEPEPAPEDDDEGRSRSEPAAKKEAKPEPPPINDLGRYVEQRVFGWELSKPEPGSDASGYATAEYRLHAKKNSGKRVGWVHEWRNDERTYALIAFCGEEDFKKQVKIWRYMAKKIRLSEPSTADTSKWVRYYERRPEFKNPEFRITRRMALERGWKAEDTENYIILYSTKDEALIRTIKRELEAIRKAYLELFPPMQEITAVSAVRVCKDKDEYHFYGGPRGSGGYWYDVKEELVFFDYQDKDGDRGSGKADSRIVLYHEAFHQYIYYSSGAVAPHSWFNEGHGDFFSGVNFDRSGKVSRIGVNPWRYNTIQRAIQNGSTISFKEITKFSQREFYNGKRIGICYPQAWSMIYFLRKSKAVERREDWSAILPNYFAELKRVFDLEYAQLEKAGLEEDEDQLDEAKKRSRDAAVKVAFTGIDMYELEEAWREFMADLDPPR